MTISFFDKYFRQILLCWTLLIASTFAGCSVTPVYGVKGQAVRQSLGAIEVGKIESRLGYFTHQELKSRLSGGGGTTSSGDTYKLDVETELKRSGSLLRLNEVAVRYDYTAKADVSLVNSVTGKVEYSFKSSITTSADDPDSPYASLVVQKDVERHLGALLGEEIYDQLSLYFLSQG